MHMDNAWSDIITSIPCLALNVNFFLNSCNAYGISPLPLPQNHMVLFEPYSFLNLKLSQSYDYEQPNALSPT